MRAQLLVWVACLSGLSGLCGGCGKTEASLGGAVTLDGGGHDSATTEHVDAGRDSSIAADATGDAEVCVDIEVSSADLACNEDSDCSLVGATGHVCTTDCCGGGTPANTAAATRIAAQEQGLTASICPGGCPAGPHPRCIDGACTACPPGFDPAPPACVDASAPDGATCININGTFPGTCTAPSDCAAVMLGTVCSSTCSCEANTAIPAIWLPSYQTNLGGITLASCHCPPSQATCLNGACILCPSPGMPNPPMGCD